MTDPSDETQPHPTVGPAAPGRAPDPGQASDPGRAPDPPRAPAPGDPVLRADPDRPADSGWREPAWIPPRERDNRPSFAAIIVGLVMIAIGVWFFLDRTLGVDLPRLQWSMIWPIVLIVIGGLILIRSIQRRA